MDRIALGELEHTVERAWISQPVQDWAPVIRVGKLGDGRWWVERSGAPGWSGAWACDSELRAEEVADRWSRRTGLRWRQIDPALVSPRRSCA